MSLPLRLEPLLLFCRGSRRSQLERSYKEGKKKRVLFDEMKDWFMMFVTIIMRREGDEVDC